MNYMTDSQNIILKVQDGSFAYKNSRQILTDINFGLGKGEILAVLGPNGAGKTTLLRCITGILKWNSGYTKLHGKNIEDMTVRSLWTHIAYVPQVKNQGTAYTAMQMVMLGRSSKIGTFSSPGQVDIDIVIQTMQNLGIHHLANKPCYELSGGELQMVMIAKALVVEPEIVILDEPESNLDFKNQLIVLNTIRRLADDGMSFIFNTHYPSHALRWADRSLMISDSGKCEYGKSGDIITRENIREFFGVEAIIDEVKVDGDCNASVVIPTGLYPYSSR